MVLERRSGNVAAGWRAGVLASWQAKQTVSIAQFTTLEGLLQKPDAQGPQHLVFSPIGPSSLGAGTSGNQFCNRP